MKSWAIVIKAKDGNTRTIQLSHKYETEQEAIGEAEDIVDQEFTDYEETWGLFPSKVREC